MPWDGYVRAWQWGLPTTAGFGPFAFCETLVVSRPWGLRGCSREGRMWRLIPRSCSRLICSENFLWLADVNTRPMDFCAGLGWTGHCPGSPRLWVRWAPSESLPGLGLYPTRSLEIPATKWEDLQCRSCYICLQCKHRIHFHCRNLASTVCRYTEDNCYHHYLGKPQHCSIS